MSSHVSIGRYSIGIGDRFGRQGVAQLKALTQARNAGTPITPVWNKSFREHSIIGTVPDDTRRVVDAAVRSSGWTLPYFVDADHIGLKNVDHFIAASDFFTIDVADFIGKPAGGSEEESFLAYVKAYRGRFAVPGLRSQIDAGGGELENIAQKYLHPIKEAGKIYRHILARKGENPFVTEVSVDEAHDPQTPRELFFILAALAQEGIPVQTIAPKFSGDFLKGIDYVGEPDMFAREFEEDLHVIKFAIQRFGLPSDLKISVHSGSDKFSLYPLIHNIIVSLNAGLHLKTAGTTWLEEVIGLAASGGDGLRIARRVYRGAFERIDELCKPYESVIDIDRSKLPDPATVDQWSSEELASALRHDRSNRLYNLHLRQLLHVGYKVAAEMGTVYLEALDRHHEVVGANVAENLWKRHISPLFIGAPGA
jgi:tagaturonate epimerase